MFGTKTWKNTCSFSLSGFTQKFEETLVIFELSTFTFIKMINFILKKKRLGTELSYWAAFQLLEFEKAAVVFEISTLKLVKMKSFM